MMIINFYFAAIFAGNHHQVFLVKNQNYMMTPNQQKKNQIKIGPEMAK